MRTMALPSLASLRASSTGVVRGIAELMGDLLPAVELGQVLGGRYGRHDHRLLEGRFADREQLDLRRLLGQLLEVSLDLGVVGELAVLADLVAEELIRRRLGREPAGGQEEGGQGEDRPGHDGEIFSSGPPSEDRRGLSITRAPGCQGKAGTWAAGMCRTRAIRAW